jgi:predicted aspartyl protease
MPAYDGQSFQPPAPVATVTLRDPQSGKAVTDVKLLIDTGADVTLLPSTAIEHLGIEPDPKLRYELAGYDGRRSVAAAVDLDLVFAETVIRGRYLLTGESVGILGRDVLNFFVLQLDGPTSKWSVSRPKAN